MTVQPNIQIINVIDGVSEKKEENPVRSISILGSLRWKAILGEFVSTAFLLFWDVWRAYLPPVWTYTHRCTGPLDLV